jgi:hypothetical protein
MRKRDIRMDAKEIDDFLSRCEVVAVGAVDADGWPTATLSHCEFRNGALLLRLDATDPVAVSAVTCGQLCCVAARSSDSGVKSAWPMSNCVRRALASSCEWSGGWVWSLIAFVGGRPQILPVRVSRSWPWQKGCGFAAAGSVIVAATVAIGLSTRSGSWSANSSTDVVFTPRGCDQVVDLLSKSPQRVRSQGGRLTAEIRLTFKCLVLSYTVVKDNSGKSLTSDAAKVG